jgi:hypothetical protein
MRVIRLHFRNFVKGARAAVVVNDMFIGILLANAVISVSAVVEE